MRSSFIIRWKMQKTRLRKLLDEKYVSAVAKLAKEQLLLFSQVFI